MEEENESTAAPPAAGAPSTTTIPSVLFIAGDRPKTENDIFPKRYEKHGNIVSVSTCGLSKFSLRRGEIVKQGPKYMVSLI